MNKLTSLYHNKSNSANIPLKSEIYKKYLQSLDWKLKRDYKLNHQNKTKKRCAICGEFNNLEIHHLNYKDLISVKQNDLRILCSRCHFITHKLFKEGKIEFKNNNHNSRFIIIKNAVKKELGITNKNMFYLAESEPTDKA